MTDPTSDNHEEVLRILDALVTQCVAHGFAPDGAPFDPTVPVSRGHLGMACTRALKVLGKAAECSVCGWLRPLDSDGNLAPHAGSCRRSKCRGGGRAPRTDQR